MALELLYESLFYELFYESLFYELFYETLFLENILKTSHIFELNMMAKASVMANRLIVCTRIMLFL